MTVASFIPTLAKLTRQFEKDPRRVGKEMAMLAAEHGYDKVRPALLTLKDLCRENIDQYHIVAQLLRPEWVWRKSKDTRNRLYMGLSEPGENVHQTMNCGVDFFQPLGYYEVGKYETGEVTICLPDDECLSQTFLSEIAEDPLLHPRKNVTRIKIKQEGPGEFFLVRAGRVVDLLREGFEQSLLILTEGKGYLSKFPAYVRVRGPMSFQEAKACQHQMKKEGESTLNY